MTTVGEIIAQNMELRETNKRLREENCRLRQRAHEAAHAVHVQAKKAAALAAEHQASPWIHLPWKGYVS
jgi:regulator of replication initiation timing